MSLMEDKRKYKRFPSQLGARYLEEGKEEWINCCVVDVSREGMGIEIYMQEAIKIGSILQFEIAIPAKEKQISAMGTLMWIKELRGNTEFNFVGGVKLITIDPEDKWELLDYVYEDWSKEEEK